MAITGGNVGCLAKRVTYKGVSAHAGGCPWDGCNALYAANLGLSAINAIRETFQEKDRIRVHPIITQGGGAVNAIPDKVCLESFVRGSNFDGIKDANRRVNRALIGGALSLGANIDICDDPGYAPLKNDPGMKEVAAEAAKMFPNVPVYCGDDISSGRTDMGDLGCIMPVVHPYMPGASGTSHGSDYRIADPVLACVGSAKWQLGMLYLLLKEDAKRAKEILAKFTPRFPTKEAYFAYLDTVTSSGERIAYTDGTATVQL
jgi:metal-dependent amidase/aminoacylase/carboxypeptidase family protein